MNLNFHIIHAGIPETTVTFVQDMDEAAYQALVDRRFDEDSLQAMAELVDWEEAFMPALGGLAMRCRRALKQRLVEASPEVLNRLADRCACVRDIRQHLAPYHGPAVAFAIPLRA